MSTQSRPRSAFTLIELLVVIAIISILAALTTAAVQKVRQRGDVVKCRADMDQLGVAITAFKAKMGVYPPCYGGGAIGANKNQLFRLQNNMLNLPLTRGGTFTINDEPEIIYMKRLFPRIDLANIGTGVPASMQLLDPNQCMVVFLSGGSFTDYTGFSTDPQRPFNKIAATPSRLNGGTFFENFTPARMRAPSSYMTEFYSSSAGKRFTGDSANAEPWFLDPWGHPYFYSCSDNGNDYPGASPVGPWGGTYSPNAAGFAPFKSSSTKFFNEKSFQIVSMGRDGKMSPGGVLTQGSGAFDLNSNGGDDFVNFLPRQLAATE